MNKLMNLLWSQLRRHLPDLRVLLLLGIVITGVVSWLAPSSGRWPRPAVDDWLATASSQWPSPAARHGAVARRSEGMTVSAHLTHIWLSEPLVNLAKRESWSAQAQRHQQVREILAGQEGRGFFYAFRVEIHYANRRVDYIDYIRHPIREPANVPELVDVMAMAAGNPPQHQTADFSNAVVHVVSAGTSRQGLVDEIEAASLSHDSELLSQ
jgi:hypothetical protein